MSASIFWYDFETTGVNPRADRVMQVAGIRTNEALEEIGQPLNVYCQLSDDILPHPVASLVTGIRYEQVAHEGLPEAEFVARLHRELIQSQTCTAGFNSVRFDDEFTRYALYRNFYDPYAREWQGGNSRWDILDALRCAWALRPGGIEWPVNDEGSVSFRLERLTQANAIEHGQAHDALADVRATIAVARLLRRAQPRLYQYLYNLRRKEAVQKILQIGQPVVHVSGRFSVQRHCLAVVVPIMQHPVNRNAFVVCDLQSDIKPLLELSAQQIKDRLYTRHAELAEGQLPIGLKLVHLNKCPVVAPLSVLGAHENERLGIDERSWRNNLRQLMAQHKQLCAKLAEVFGQDEFASLPDPEQQLYDGFIQNRDRSLCDQIRHAEPQQLLAQRWPFDDVRLPELLFRYRARNYPDSLTAQESQQWHQFCALRLNNIESGAPLTIKQYLAEFALLDSQQQQLPLMQEWLAHVRRLQQNYAVP